MSNYLDDHLLGGCRVSAVEVAAEVPQAQRRWCLRAVVAEAAVNEAVVSRGRRCGSRPPTLSMVFVTGTLPPRVGPSRPGDPWSVASPVGPP
jgi:hypothetical protein